MNATTTIAATHIPPTKVFGISTQLLTLSTHDDLTFEGTEIAIHPELFLSPSASSTNTANTTDNNSNVTSTITNSSSSTNELSSLLEVNDLILIRVWDSKNSKEQKSNHTNKKSNKDIIVHHNELSLSNCNVNGNDDNNDDDPLFKTHNLRTYILMRITETSLSSFKQKSSIGSRVQISLLRTVADLYNISSFSQITITKILNKQYQFQLYTTATADFVTIIFKDQFISRGDMFHFQNLLLGKLIYEGKRLNSGDGIRANAKCIKHLDQTTKSGFVTPDTKIIFRSRSARIIWLIQLSLEMWDYVDPYNDAQQKNNNVDTSHCTNSCCEIYFDTLINFIYKLFRKWKEMDATHSLTVVFFSRTYWRMNTANSPVLGCPNTSMDSSNASGFNRSPKHASSSFSNEHNTATYVDIDGRLYEDHYKVIIENETRNDWESLVNTIKKEFIKYPTEVQWDYNSNNPNAHVRIPSTASQGNILEAINVTLNLLQLHYMDRDLHRTGNSIVVYSAGSGVFEVDKNLASMTKQRMMDNGIGSDMLSLGLPPLHVAPFFLYKEVSEALQEESHGYDDWKTYFEIPHWMHLSFINYDQDDAATTELHSQKQHQKSNTTEDNIIKNDLPILSSNGEKKKGIEIGSNGLLIRKFNQEITTSTSSSTKTTANINNNDDIDASNSSNNSVQNKNNKNNPKYRSTMQQRNLISDRNFNDILQACQPVYRGESNIALPSALKASLVLGRFNNNNDDDGSKEINNIDDPNAAIISSGSVIENDDTTANNNWSPFSLGTPLVANTRPFSIERQRQQSNMDGSAEALSMQLQEWGTVNFNEFCALQLQQQQLLLTSNNLNSSLTMVSHESPPWETASYASCETASPSSSFNSHFSYLLHRRIGGSGGIATNSAIDEMNEVSGHQRAGSNDTNKLSPLFVGLQIQKPSSNDFLSMESYMPAEMISRHQEQEQQKMQKEIKKEPTPNKEKFRRNKSENILRKLLTDNNEDELGHNYVHVPLSSSCKSATGATTYPRSKSDGDEKEMENTIDVSTMETAIDNIDATASEMKEHLKLSMNAYDNQIFLSPLSHKSNVAKQQQQPSQQHFISNTAMGNSTHSIQSILIPSVLEKNPLDNSKSGGIADPKTRGVAATGTGTRVMTKRSGKSSGGEGIGAALTNYNKCVNEARLRHQQQDASCLTYPPVVANANTLEVLKARRKILELVNHNNLSSTQSMMIIRGSPDKLISLKPLGHLHRNISVGSQPQQVTATAGMDVATAITAGNGGPKSNRLPDHAYSSGILNQYPYNIFFAPPPITVSHGTASTGTSNKRHVIKERTKIITPTSAATDNNILDSLSSQRQKTNNIVSFKGSSKKSENNTTNIVDKQQQQQTNLKVAHQRVLKHISKKHEHQYSAISADQLSRSKKNNRHHHQKIKHHHHNKRHTSSRSSSNKTADMPLTSPNTATTTNHRKPWVLNPFRQRDETEILLRRTANRRRWSHVFPLGEEEFKRHSGPLWNSLCQPAVLPLTIDVFPSPKELNNTNKFQFNPYQITLDAMDGTYYKSHTDLLEEMITQRLIQDFQIVPPSVVQSAKRAEVVDMRKARQSIKAKANRSRRHRKGDIGTSSKAVNNDGRRSSIVSSIGSNSSGGILDVANAFIPRHRDSSDMKIDKSNSISRVGNAEARKKEMVIPLKSFGISCSPPTGFSRYMQNIATGDYDDPYSSSGSTVQCTLSMGHKIHIISYNPVSNDIEVVQHTAAFAQNDLRNTLTYNYMLWVPSIQKYKRVVQHFTKYGNSRFQWSYLDNLICGDPQKTLSEGTRFRRNAFCIIPEKKNFMDDTKEQEYVQKFKRLLDYLSKLKQQNNNDTSSISPSNDKINIQIVTTNNNNEANDATTSSEQQDNRKGRKQSRSIAEDYVKHFIVPLRRKGGRDGENKFEWMELVMDGIFYTNRSYSMTVQWLVASANKVDTQTQLLQRRCAQYGLHLVSIPQSSISSNPFLNPFIAPPCIPVRDKEKAIIAEEALANKFHFIFEGSRYTYPQFLDGIDQFNFQFDDNTRRSKTLKEVAPGKQYIHPTGGLFVRVLKDDHGWAIFVVMKNRNLVNIDGSTHDLERSFIKEFCMFIHES